MGVNLLLKFATIKLVEWVGEETESKQKVLITRSVFYAQFFNTGFLILIVNANLKQYEPKEITMFFDGSFTDYMPQWYLDVGIKITQTLCIQSLMPLIWLCINTTKLWAKKLFDSKFTGNPCITRSTTMSKYKAVYGGPEYKFHFKYSEMLNIIFVSMLYGLGMPILFVIAAFALFVAYVVERINLAFIARQPPAMDDALTMNALKMIRYAPLFMLANGWWMVGNRQIFANLWHYKQNDLQPMWSSHYLYQIEFNQAAPLLLLAVTAVLFTVFAGSFAENLGEWGFSSQKPDVKVSENLPNFWKAVKFSQA